MSSARLRTPVRVVTLLAVLLAGLTLSPGSAHAIPVPDCAAANIGVTSLGGPNFYIDSGSSPEFRSGYTGYRITNGTQTNLEDVWVSLTDFTGGSLGLASGQAAAQRAGDLDAAGTAARFWYLTASGTSASAQNHAITVYSHNPALPNAEALCTATNGFASVQGTLAASANKVTGISVAGGTPKLGSTFTVTVTGDTGTIGAGVTGDAESLWMTPAVVESWPADAFRLIGTKLMISPDGTAAQQEYLDTLRVAGLGSANRPYTATYTFQAVGFTSSPTTVKPVQEIASGTQVKHTGSYSVTLPAIQPATSDLATSITATPAKLDLGGGTSTLTGSVSGTAGAELDSLTLTLPDGASVVPGTATWGGISIDDPAGTGSTLVFAGPFVVGTNKLTVDVTFDGTPGSREVTLIGTIGDAKIGSSPTPTDGSNPASTTVSVDTAPVAGDKSVVTTPITPITVNISPLVTDADGDVWSITGTSEPGYGTVSVNGRLVTYTPYGEFEGFDSFTYTVGDGRGGTATGTINVLVDPEAQPPNEPTPQSIEFTTPQPIQAGDGTELTATADSGLPVTFTSGTPEVCTVAGSTVTAIAEGSCEITAHQHGDATYAPADPVTRTFTVTAQSVEPTPQSIEFLTPDPMLVGDETTVTATATSELPVTLVTETPETCSVGETGVVVALAAGECTLTASQSGDATYAAAEPVSRTFTISKRTQSITFEPAASLLGTAPYEVQATSTSELPVGLAVTDGDCALDGTSLIPAGAGSCTVEASQTGDGTYAAATPVPATITFTMPGDDTAETAGATPVVVDVLDNDPQGVALDEVTTPEYGSASVVDGTVTYQPNTAFRGTDTFDYTVAAGGRTATATVVVTVANLGPAVAGGSLTQLAGTSKTLTLQAGDPNDDEVTLTATSANPLVGVRVDGTVLTVSAGAAASGNVAITVTATDGAGGTATSTVTTRITPLAPTAVGRRLAGNGTAVRWTTAPTAGAVYEVLLDGKVFCRTAATSCATRAILGPRRAVSVRTVGRDGTRSELRRAPLTGHGQVLVATVYFASDSARLTARDRGVLDTAIGKVHRYGFGRAALDGYTDADGGLAYNIALSHRRTGAVATYLRRHGELASLQSWHGERNPAASNGDASGKARNRRVEILVRY